MTLAELHEKHYAGDGPIVVPLAEWAIIVGFLHENSFAYDEEGNLVKYPPFTQNGHYLLFGRELILE